LAVTGAVWIGAVGTAGVVATPPAAAPPVLAATALEAPTAASIRLQRIALHVRTNTKTTSFVGLRG
jgi:hypothetical protein